MIPKIIHYCWYGKGTMDDKTHMCISSWKTHCPDFTFICWDEDNTDFSMNPYLKEAYEAKKYAFVTDYMRLYALKKYGGIYMDTDMEVIKPLDPLCQYPAFTGIQDETVCCTGIMGAEPEHEWINKLFHYYDNRHFIKEDGSLDLCPNIVFMTEYTKELYGWEYREGTFEVPGKIIIFPFEIFCCKDYETGHIYRTQDSITIHHFKGSWVDKKNGVKSLNIKVKRLLIKLMGYPKYRELLCGVRRWKYGKK